MTLKQTLLTEGNEMATVETTALSRSASGSLATSPMEILERAVMSGRSPDELKGLMDLIERTEARQAERAYAVAMNACKSELPVVVPDKINTETGKKYPSLEAVGGTIDSIITKHGFSLSFGSKPCDTPNHILLTCRCRHLLGHFEDHELLLPYDTTGPKGGANKSPIQGMVSSVSYGKRTLKLMAFDVTVANQDKDGGGDAPRLDDNEQMRMQEFLDTKDVNWFTFKRWLKIEAISEIPKSRYEEVMDWLKNRGPKK